MSNKLVLLVVLAVIAAAAAVPVDKEQTPVVEEIQDNDKPAVEAHDGDKTAAASDKDSSSESEDIANRQFYYPLYPGKVVVQPGLVPVQPVVPVRPVVPVQPVLPVQPVVPVRPVVPIQPILPVQPVVPVRPVVPVQPILPVQPVVPVRPVVPVQPGYPIYVRPGYAHSSVWVQRN